MREVYEAFAHPQIALKNRLVMPPMASNRADDEGLVTEELLAWYDQKTRDGKMGLVIVEHAYVDVLGKASPQQLSAAHDEVLPGLAQLAALLHANGTKAVLQLSHAGGNALVDAANPVAYGPSDLDDVAAGKEMHAMGRRHIQDVINAFQAAAWRAKKAGFDGIELHGAHGFLLNQFYSPLTNLRSDEYGGDVAGRLKLALEIIKKIQLGVGRAYPLFYRLGAMDYMPGGNELADAVLAAQLLAKAGVDVLDISGGLCGIQKPDGDLTPGWFADASTPLRVASGLPVILTGGISTPEECSLLIEAGCADLVGIGRKIDDVIM